MHIDDLYKKVSNKLFNIFYVDHKKYGRQKENGSYHLVKETLSVVTIDDMLRNQKSLLTYQELHVVNTARIKWICIDLDISKKEIDQNDINITNLTLVKEGADIVCSFLESKGIPYLLEFSGRRGFHVWIIFDKIITKELGYRLIEVITKSVRTEIDDRIFIDKFPKTSFVSKNSKGIGFGIKLPLSQNKSSGTLSFFLDKDKYFDFNKENWKTKPDINFLRNQLSILDSLSYFSIAKLEEFLKINEDASLNVRYNKLKKVNSFLSNNLDLNEILDSLKKCHHLNHILYDYEKGINRKERSILVGLLIQLKTKQDDNFGYNLLLELFSNVEGFNEEITKRNLENLKYYQPITCKSLDRCPNCNECNLYSPIELIDGIVLAEQPKFAIRNITETFFEKLKNSVSHYSFQNDEVPFYIFLKKLEKLDFENTKSQINIILEGEIDFEIESYKLHRNENEKVRDLYILDPLNNVMSIFFAFSINTLFFSEISNNSYGYQFSPSLYLNNIFNNWFANWAKYTRKIETVLFNEEYGDYFMIKFDIKSFYDSIDIKRLQIKLFEEAPRKIIDKFSELSDDDINKYKNIVDYLISLTVKITGSEDKGLPQGPAYARYLAELYLNGLDNMIETFILEDEGRGFYNRFVDDVFVFVESEERAVNLFKKIKDWISINGLEINYSKTKLCNVTNYANSGEYQKFKDNTKYEINKVKKRKNVLSENEIQEAFSKLTDLTSTTKFGLTDNLRFFYYQIKNDNRLDFIRRRLSQKLPFSTDGRGTLYWLFYSDLISNHPLIFWELVPKSALIKGLSLTHFLNSILMSEDLENKDIPKLISDLSNRSDLSDADKVLIALLNLKHGANIKLKFDEKIMNSALGTPNIKFHSSNWEIVNQKLERIENGLKLLKEIDRIIKDYTYDVEFLNKLAQYCFIRFSEWYTVEASVEFMNDSGNLLLYYHVLCFLTLFEVSESYDVVQFSWELLLEKSEKIGSLPNKDYEFIWINKLEEFTFEDFSNGSYSLILNDKKGNTLSTKKCPNEFREQYKNVLLMLLFAKDKAGNFKDFRNSVSQYIDSESLFFDWVNSSSVSLYPQADEICLKNIALNGLIVLKKSDKLFIKSIKKKINFDIFDYLNISGGVSEIQEVEYEYSNEILDDKIKGHSVCEVLGNLNNILSEQRQFTNIYKTNQLCFYRPSLVSGTKPMIPFYSDKSFEFIVTQNGAIEKNSINNYWNNLMSIVSKLDNIILFPNDISNPFNFSLKDFESRFFPVSSIFADTVETKIQFIEKFIFISENEIPKSIFEYQYNWSSTVLSILKDLQSDNEYFIEFLKVHFDQFVDNEGKARLDVFFAVNEIITINDKTLSSFFETIKSSISIFQAQVENLTIDFTLEVDNFLKNIFSAEANVFGLHESDFLLENITVVSKYDQILQKQIFKILLDGEELQGDYTVLFFDSYLNTFNTLELQELQVVISNKQKIYYKISGNNFFIYLPDDELLKAFERIKIRDAIYSESHDISIVGNLNIRKLFPQALSSKVAEKSYDTYHRKDILEKKLFYHYPPRVNIRDRVVSWLSLFSKSVLDDSELYRYMNANSIDLSTLYETILDILESHYSMDEEDLDFFKSRLLAYNNDENTIIFPIKNPKYDENGLARLIDRCGFQPRTFNFFEYKNQLYKKDCKGKKLVIVTDLSISGGQFHTAWKYYNQSHEIGDDINNYNNTRLHSKSTTPEQERYFCFDTIEESQRFRENISGFANITLLSPMMTESFAKKVQTISEVFAVEHSKELISESKYLYGKAKFNNSSENLFLKLSTDFDLINKIFNNTSFYEKMVNEESLKKSNIILRPQSLPAHHLLLFSLESKNGIKLLDHIRNW